MTRVALTLCLVASAALRASAQRIEIIDAATLPRFDVVSVKPGDPKLESKLIDVSPGRLVQENAPLWNAISLAFDVRPAQLATPLPDLITRELFTIDARLPVTATTTELKLMLRALLIDRFELRAHVDAREQDAYALTIARRDSRLGAQLRASRVDCRGRAEAQRRNEPVSPIPEGSKPCTFTVGPGSLDLGGVPLSALVAVISGQVGRPVLDKTGLEGTFDAEMKWTPDAGDGPSLVTALREQLGLRLEPARTSIDYLVIDHIERPAPD